jgi:hypothetical protein
MPAHDHPMKKIKMIFILTLSEIHFCIQKMKGPSTLCAVPTFRQDQMLNFGERESYDHPPGFSKHTFEQKSKLHPPWTWAQMVWVQCHFLWQLICSCMLHPPTIFSTISTFKSQMFTCDAFGQGYCTWLKSSPKCLICFHILILQVLLSILFNQD